MARQTDSRPPDSGTGRHDDRAAVWVQFLLLERHDASHHLWRSLPAYAPRRPSNPCPPAGKHGRQPPPATPRRQAGVGGRLRLAQLHQPLLRHRRHHRHRRPDGLHRHHPYAARRLRPLHQRAGKDGRLSRRDSRHALPAPDEVCRGRRVARDSIIRIQQDSQRRA